MRVVDPAFNERADSRNALSKKARQPTSQQVAVCGDDRTFCTLIPGIPLAACTLPPARRNLRLACQMPAGLKSAVVRRVSSGSGLKMAKRRMVEPGSNRLYHPSLFPIVILDANLGSDGGRPARP
jgi:hypothetical protein